MLLPQFYKLDTVDRHTSLSRPIHLVNFRVVEHADLMTAPADCLKTLQSEALPPIADSDSDRANQSTVNGSSSSAITHWSKDADRAAPMKRNHGFDRGPGMLRCHDFSFPSVKVVTMGEK